MVDKFDVSGDFILNLISFQDLEDIPISPEEIEKAQLEMLFKGEFINKNEPPRPQLMHIMHLLRSRLLHFIDILHNYLMSKVGFHHSNTFICVIPTFYYKRQPYFLE